MVSQGLQSWAAFKSLVGWWVDDELEDNKKTLKYSFASSDPHHGIQFIPSDILSGKSSGIRFEILSGISSDILAGIFI